MQRKLLQSQRQYGSFSSPRQFTVGSAYSALLAKLGNKSLCRNCP